MFNFTCSECDLSLPVHVLHRPRSPVVAHLADIGVGAEEVVAGRGGVKQATELEEIDYRSCQCEWQRNRSCCLLLLL